MQREVARLVPPGKEKVEQGKLPQTVEAKKVIIGAIEEARNLNHTYVGTEHMLLGLLRQPESVAVQAIMNLQVPLEQLRQDVLLAMQTSDERAGGPLIVAKANVETSQPSRQEAKPPPLEVAIWVFGRRVFRFPFGKRGRGRSQ